MFYKIDFQTAQHLCGLVSRFFDNIAESAPEHPDGIRPRGGDFLTMCRDFTFDPAELEGAEALDEKVIALAKAVLNLSE